MTSRWPLFIQLYIFSLFLHFFLLCFLYSSAVSFSPVASESVIHALTDSFFLLFVLTINAFVSEGVIVKIKAFGNVVSHHLIGGEIEPKFSGLS